MRRLWIFNGTIKCWGSSGGDCTWEVKSTKCKTLRESSTFSLFSLILCYFIGAFLFGFSCFLSAASPIFTKLMSELHKVHVKCVIVIFFAQEHFCSHESWNLFSPLLYIFSCCKFQGDHNYISQCHIIMI